jgi:hypothetical protein
VFVRNMQRHHSKQTPWSESASELYRPSDRRLSGNLVANFADRGCGVVRATDPYCSILAFLDRKDPTLYRKLARRWRQGED